MGFEESGPKGEVVADAVLELLRRQVVTWNLLSEAMKESLEHLEDLKIDVPMADQFVHALFAKLLIETSNGKTFPWKSVLLDLLPYGDGQGSTFTWSVLCGALRKVQKIGGQEAYRKALDASEMRSHLCKAKTCSDKDLQKYLQEEIR